jgi:hypothetical protein
VRRIAIDRAIESWLPIVNSSRMTPTSTAASTTSPSRDDAKHSRADQHAQITGAPVNSGGPAADAR